MSSYQLISQSQAEFLNLRHLPARIDVQQTATLLGHHPDHIPILVEGKFLKPLGNPSKNGVKMFATSEILEKAKDQHWLDQASKYIARKWQQKNAKCKQDHYNTSLSA